MGMIGTLVTTTTLVLAGWWVWQNAPEVRKFVTAQVDSKEFRTLEIRHPVEEIMTKNKKDLLPSAKHTFLDPQLLFCPYALLEVKYSKDEDSTREGIILWSLVDGEMVLSTEKWEKTHGLQDCLSSRASKEDFKVLNALAANGGSMDRKHLLKNLHVENETLDQWVENCRKKNLIVQSGNIYRLHLENAKLTLVPETRVNHWVVSKPQKGSAIVTERYSLREIESCAKAAFGRDFTIRSISEVYLPVYCLPIQNPDGSTYTTYWNAVTGHRTSEIYH